MKAWHQNTHRPTFLEKWHFTPIHSIGSQRYFYLLSQRQTELTSASTRLKGSRRGTSIQDCPSLEIHSCPNATKRKRETRCFCGWNGNSALQIHRTGSIRLCRFVADRKTGSKLFLLVQQQQQQHRRFLLRASSAQDPQRNQMEALRDGSAAPFCPAQI